MDRHSGVYPATPSLVEWVSNEDALHAIEQSTFKFWRDALPLVHIVQRVTEGRMQRISAEAAIRQFNQEEGTQITFEDVLHLNSTFVFSDAGEWVLFTDAPYELLLGGHDDPFDAICSAARRGVAEWLILWFTRDDLFLVFASPFEDLREETSDYDMAEGLIPGPVLTAILPPQIEAAVKQDLGVLAYERYYALSP